MTRGLDSRIKVEPPFYDSSLFLFLLFSFFYFALLRLCARGIGHAPHANVQLRTGGVYNALIVDLSPAHTAITRPCIGLFSFYNLVSAPSNLSGKSDRFGLFFHSRFMPPAPNADERIDRETIACSTYI